MAGFLDFLKDPQFLNGIATAMQSGGQVATGIGQAEHGEALRAAADFQAAQLRQQAGSAMASAQRRAWGEERNTQYLASKTLATAAGSGGGASDPTVINLIAEQAAEGSYRQQVAIYEGADRSRTLRLQAIAKEYEGATQERAAKAAGRASMIGAGTTLLKGYAKGSSIYERFGNGGPKTETNPWTRDGEGDY